MGAAHTFTCPHMDGWMDGWMNGWVDGWMANMTKYDLGLCHSSAGRGGVHGHPISLFQKEGRKEAMTSAHLLFGGVIPGECRNAL